MRAIDISASVPDGGAERCLLRHFNLLVRRGDRIGIVVNGIGKINLSSALLEPDPPPESGGSDRDLD
ncbi:MAG: hypothetical protein CM15mP46_6600 [Alphaproteobacteria bacterium]|nr:MAG: hypothetical protein CM15mP46_6600 [Alphaproteobacteria bacterium]